MSSATQRIVLIWILVVCLAQFCFGNSNLRGGSEATERVSVEEVQRSLLEEINQALNISNVHQGRRVAEFEAELSNMFKALPKTEKGSLGHTTVHYALHRLFMERHGWFFKGLEPGGAAWSSIAPGAILKDRVPSYIQQLFEAQLGGQGFALRELAVLAATLEHLVNNEARERLLHIFQLLNLPLEGEISREKSDRALDTYMMAQITQADLADITALTPEGLAEFHAKAKGIFPDYEQAQGLVRETAVTDGNHMDFASAAVIAAEAGKHLGQWHKGKCQVQKNHLISLGDQQVGRVSLASFYADALSRADQTVSSQTEHIQYLRKLGALDESVYQKPTVLVPNYVSSPANCFASSSFYSICCPSECESVMRHLESEVAGPTMKPAHVQELIARLPAAIVSGPRELPAPLLDRLQEIALKHGGDIPIHGRLFAQFLHHAYPRECPYPHVAGATRPQTADEWMAETGQKSSHTREEREDFVKNAVELEVPEDGDLTNPVVLPWSDNEELLIVRSEFPHMPEQAAEESPEQGHPLTIIRCIVFALALSMMAWRVKEQLAGVAGLVRAAVGKSLKGHGGKSLE